MGTAGEKTFEISLYMLLTRVVESGRLLKLKNQDKYQINTKLTDRL